ncbi:sulfatase family protein [Ruania alba]|uniref:Arylsulfatase A n=1 Tax=Ruania alba TaxID=648782 RepID=A0A1H5KMU9_9MICO|nr:sulfatase [Ruania alba]SEE65401.1 Arylsulfatase A [Ruania alba]
MPDSRRPNIVLILSDDHAAHAMGCYGSQVNETPSLDRIATEGVRFDRAGCTNALCAPSRASILTGTHSHRNGMMTLTTPFDSTQPTFPALMQAAGYRTALFGKWHLGHGAGHDPDGFDEWQILDGQGEYDDPELISPAGRTQHPGYVTDVLTDLALDWLDQQDGTQPWLLLLWHKAPHRRWFPGPHEQHLYTDVTFPEPSTLFDDYEGRADAAGEAAIRVGRDLDELDVKTTIPAFDTAEERTSWFYQRYMRDYLRCVAGIDRTTGRLLDYLDATEQSDDTLVTYASDQGFFLGDHGWFDKRFMYSDSMRIPLVMRYPAEIPPGTVSTDFALNLDLAQTFLDFAGIEAPDRMQGRSLRPLCRGEATPWRTHVYYRYWEHLKAGVGAHVGVRTERYALIHYYGEALGVTGAIDDPRPAEWELFDLESDPQELRSCYHDPAYAQIRDELTELLVVSIREAHDSPPPSLQHLACAS